SRPPRPLGSTLIVMLLLVLRGLPELRFAVTLRFTFFGELPLFTGAFTLMVYAPEVFTDALELPICAVTEVILPTFVDAVPVTVTVPPEATGFVAVLIWTLNPLP